MLSVVIYFVRKKGRDVIVFYFSLKYIMHVLCENNYIE